jgi:YD repeat-containing protein
MATPVFNQTPFVGNRPIGKLDAQGRVIPSTFEDLAYQADDGSGTTITYKGWARVGASTSAAVWKIQKLTYDASGNVLTITWPQNTAGIATAEYEFIWANRASLTYS